MSHLESHCLSAARAFHLGAGRAGRAVPTPEQHVRRWSARDHDLIASRPETVLTPLETVRVRQEQVEAVAHGLEPLRPGAVGTDVELVKGHAELLQIADDGTLRFLSVRTLWLTLLMELLRHLQTSPLHSLYHSLAPTILRASQDGGDVRDARFSTLLWVTLGLSC